MTKDFLSSLGVCVKILLLFFLSINDSFAQILPSSFGLHHKPSEASVNYSLLFDADGEFIYTNGNRIFNTWTVEVWYKRTANNFPASFLRENLGNDIWGSWVIRLCNEWSGYLGVAIGNIDQQGTWYGSTPVIYNWEHVVIRNNSSGYFTHLMNGQNQGGLTWYPHLNWTFISNSNSGLRGEIDEVRIWNDYRSDDEIIDNMHIELQGNESNLVAYYKMSDGNGTSLSDNSSNSYTGIITGATWATSYAPIGNLLNSFKNKPYALWKKTGTSDSRSSNGLILNVGVSLSESNFVVYGNNNTSGTLTTDLPSGESLQKRSSREWQFDEVGSVTANIKIDISLATGNTVIPAAASNYKLLYRSCSMCSFTVVATGASTSGDVITFSSVAIQDGFYAIGSTDTNL